MQLIEHCKTHRLYQKGQILFSEGEAQIGVYCVQSGCIKIYKSRGNRRHILYLVDGGDILGAPSLFCDQIHGETAEVVQEAEVCFFHKEGFLSAVRQDPTLAGKLLARLSRNFFQLEEREISAVCESARVRLATFLLTLKKTGGGHELGVLLTRKEMCEAVGMRLETLVRLMKEFERDHLIEMKGKAVSILNEDQLLSLTLEGY